MTQHILEQTETLIYTQIKKLKEVAEISKRTNHIKKEDLYSEAAPILDAYRERPKIIYKKLGNKYVLKKLNLGK